MDVDWPRAAGVVCRSVWLRWLRVAPTLSQAAAPVSHYLYLAHSTEGRTFQSHLTLPLSLSLSLRGGLNTNQRLRFPKPSNIGSQIRKIRNITIYSVHIIHCTDINSEAGRERKREIFSNLTGDGDPMSGWKLELRGRRRSQLGKLIRFCRIYWAEWRAQQQQQQEKEEEEGGKSGGERLHIAGCTLTDWLLCLAINDNLQSPYWYSSHTSPQTSLSVRIIRTGLSVWDCVIKSKLQPTRDAQRTHISAPDNINLGNSMRIESHDPVRSW